MFIIENVFFKIYFNLIISYKDDEENSFYLYKFNKQLYKQNNIKNSYYYYKILKRNLNFNFHMVHFSTGDDEIYIILKNDFSDLENRKIIYKNFNEKMKTENINIKIWC